MNKTSENKANTNTYLSFRLGNEAFALNVDSVLSIQEVQKITEVPQAPIYMKGVINLRGTVLPIIDTRLKLGMEPIEFTSNTCILVLEVDINNEIIQVGILVDSVEEVKEISEDQIQPPPGLGSNYKSEYIIGVAKLNDSFIMLMDIIKLFTVDEISVLDKSSKITV